MIYDLVLCVVLAGERGHNPYQRGCLDCLCLGLLLNNFGESGEGGGGGGTFLGGCRNCDFFLQCSVDELR